MVQKISHDLDLIDELQKPVLTLNAGKLIHNELDKSAADAMHPAKPEPRISNYSDSRYW